MKYTSTSTEVTVVTVKRFALSNTEPRKKRYSKATMYRPEDLWVTYESRNGNVKMTQARVSGPRILKNGEGDTVTEDVRTWWRDDDTLDPYFEIIAANQPGLK